MLNLDADLELAAGPGYSPKQSVRAALAAFVPVLGRSLLAVDDVLVGETTAPGAARGRVGRAFMPTPRALSLLERAGAKPEPAPSFEILRRVNSRAFCASIGQTLPGAAFVTTEGEARALLATMPEVGKEWRLKRAFGMTGRNQRVFRDEADSAFVVAGVAEGGLQIEPNVVVAEEYGVHGFIGRRSRLGHVCVQECDARGAWVSTRHAGTDVDPELVSHLMEQASLVARALENAGYFGPFGVDAFAYTRPGGGLALQPRSEINARYSMGYAVGMTP